jgi:hypothetical protein
LLSPVLGGPRLESGRRAWPSNEIRRRIADFLFLIKWT